MRLRRILVTSALGVVVAGCGVLLSGTAAHAAPTLTRGAPVSAVVTTPNTDLTYLFTASAGEHVTFDVSASTWVNGAAAGSAVLRLYDPGSVYRGYVQLGQGATYGDFSLDLTGTWRVLVDPTGTATGRATFTLVGDLVGGALARSQAVTPVLAHRGRNAQYSFNAAAGEHVTFSVSASAWTSGTAAGSAVLRLYDPQGTYRGYVQLGQGVTYGDFALDTTGRWRVVIDPTGASTGRATFTLASDVAGGVLVRAGAVTSVIAYPGQNAQYAFTATAGEHVTFDVSASSWANGAGFGSAVLRLYDPANTYRGYVQLGQGVTFGDFSLDRTGRWLVVIDGTGASTGRATFTMVGDVAGGVLQRTRAVTAVVPYRGQNAQYLFTASAGEHVTFAVSASTWTNGAAAGSAVFRLYDPQGSYRGYVQLGQGVTYGDFALDKSGTWRVVIDPTSAAIGRATFTLAADVAGGVLVRATPVTSTLAYPGQNAQYAFAATAGERVRFTVSASTWVNGAAAGSAVLRLYDPAGSYRGYVLLGQGATYGDFTLDRSGTWRVLIDPASASTGRATFTLTG